MAATYDYQADADERIPPLLAEGANFAKIVELCAARWQALDDLAVELAAYVDLSEDAAAPGWMLDLIGEWLGEPRRGAWSDADYRYALRVRQRTRKSDGTWRDIYEVARLLRPDSATSDVTVDGAPKSVIVDIPALTDPVRLDIAQRAREDRAAALAAADERVDYLRRQRIRHHDSARRARPGVRYDDAIGHRRARRCAGRIGNLRQRH